MKNRLKQLLVCCMPEPIRHRVRMLYYPAVLRKFSAGDWSGSEVVQKLVVPGTRVLDVGANVGYVTMLLSRYAGDKGQVHSFEPIPSTYALLANNVKKLCLENVQTYPYAASDVSETASMTIPAYDVGGENFYEAHIDEKATDDSLGRHVEVQTRRLDDVLRADVETSFIKVDVEGHEFAVLKGAERLLAAQQPAMMIEIMGDLDAEDSDAGRVKQWLSDKGYGCYVLQEGTLVQRKEGVSSVDYFFLRSEHVEVCAP
jgi:FkbM family methyltransferase